MNLAYKLIDIVKGTDYSPVEIYEDVGGTQVAKGLSPPVYALLCTKGGTSGDITMELLGNSSPVTIPSAAFVLGTVYYMYLKKLVDDNSADVKFVGMKQKSHPFAL